MEDVPLPGQPVSESHRGTWLVIVAILAIFIAILVISLFFIFRPFGEGSGLGVSEENLVPVVCEIDPITDLSNPVTCSIEYVENPEEYANLQKEALEAYSLEDEAKVAELQEKFENIETKSASCVINPGEPSRSLENHVCSFDPEVFREKPLIVLEQEREVTGIPGLDIIGDSPFSGIECSRVDTLYDGEKYYLYCERGCYNLDMEFSNCEYENGIVKLTVTRGNDISPYPLRFDINLNWNLPPGVLSGGTGVSGREVFEVPGALETKVVEIDLTNSSEFIGSDISARIFGPSVEKRFKSRNYPYYGADEVRLRESAGSCGKDPVEIICINKEIS